MERSVIKGKIIKFKTPKKPKVDYVTSNYAGE